MSGFLAAVPPSVVAWSFDERSVLGANTWTKPIKCQLSFALHGLTICWLLNGVAIAAVVEVAYITLQGAWGRAWHFNF